MVSSAKIVFRADAGHKIGTGHVMRCLTIAESLRATGAECRFFCKAHEGHLADLLSNRGFDVELLNMQAGWSAKGHLDWLGGPIADDMMQTKKRLDETGGADLLVVDHYALDVDYEAPLRQTVARIAVIDDLHDRRHDCDLLIDQNIGHQPANFDGLVAPHVRRLVGADYAPIQAVFAEFREQSLKRRKALGKPETLLVALGGSDPDDVTSRVIDAIEPFAEFKEVHVVLSGIARHLEKVQKCIAKRTDMVLHIDTTQMPELMMHADMAIGAAGVTAIERCVLGLPTLMAVLAENQVPTAARLERLGAAISLGHCDGISARTIKEALADLIKSPERLQSMSTAAAGLCDGRGIERIIPALFELAQKDMAVA